MKQAELLKEKDILLHDVNHRVKNNLAIISGLLHLQLDRIPYDTPCRDELQGATIRIDAMNALHNALYTEAGETELSFKGYLDNVLASIDELFSEEMHNIQIQKQVDDDFEPARREYVPYGLLITEVITNSYKYAYPTKTGDIDLELKANKDGNLDHMKIQDFGKGIDTGFTNGLGTNLIYQLADQLHLHASRQSEVGEGTSWLFTPQGNSDTNNVTYDGIYIVEDERLIALSLKKTLENEGYSVIDIASSGREAIDELTTLAPKPQAVIMDIKLEDDISGIDVAYAIKNERIPIVFRSAYIDDPMKEKIQKIGLVEYEAINKTAPMKRLLDVINSYVT
jgi:two-component sensor histidine kinase/CheY-like chemotaxis protein